MIKKSKTFLSVDLFVLLMSFFEILLSQKGIFHILWVVTKKKSGHQPWWQPLV